MKTLSEVDKQIDINKKTMEVLPTGLKLLDWTLEGGFLKKELVLLGGKTGGGKSLLAGHIFWNMAKNGKNAAYFSLEISNEMIVSRLIGARSGISPTRIMIKELEGDELKAKNEGKAALVPYEQFMTFYDDKYKYEEIEKEIREHKFDFVVIDFLQNVQVAKGEEYERLSFIALSLQKLCKEANVCIMGVSQLSNMMNRDRKNEVVEYKGSGALGHACDLGFFIEDKKDTKEYLTLRLRKNRRGISGEPFTFSILQPGGRIVDL